MSTSPHAAIETPIKVKKLGHLVYEVSDIERTTKFWTDILGFKITDTSDIGMVFLCGPGDHHSIALVPTAKKARPVPSDGLQFHHLAMEVENIDVLFRARDFLCERGLKVDFEGRRGPGGNTGLEFQDPDGYMFEIYCEMDQIGADGQSRPAEQFDRVSSLEDSVARPLPAL